MSEAQEAAVAAPEPGTVVTENAYEIPEGNPHDGTEQAYEASSEEQTLEAALNEKAEAESEENQEVEAEQSEEDKRFAQKFAALSRQEKQLRLKEQEIDNKLAQLEEKLSSLQQPEQQEAEQSEPELPLEYRLKKDPFGTLNELGLSYDKLTQLALNDGKLTPDMQMELMRQEIDQKYSNEIESLRNEILEKEKQQEERQYEETVQNYMNELTNFVNDNDQYELIRANDAVDTVFDVIEDYYKETGRILSKQEAADQVEAYLEEEAERLFKLKKLQSKFGQRNIQQETTTEPKQVVKKPTLSNTQASQVSNNSGRRLTRDESVAAAAAMLKWND